MAYSAKKRWTMTGGALVLAFVGCALVLWLNRDHADPASVGLFRVALGLIVVGLGMRAVFFADEVQRQMGQKRWFWGSLIGIAAMLPVVVALQMHGLWLNAAVQFIFQHPASPPLYFSLGVVIPVVFQAFSTIALRLLDKFSPGSQS